MPTRPYEQAKTTVMAELRQTFRPEFLNRIDDIIVFRALTEQDIEEVARRMLKTVAGRMETMGIHLDAGDAAVKELAKEGFDPSMARGLCAGPSRARWRTPWPRSCWTAPSRKAIPPNWPWRMRNWWLPNNRQSIGRQKNSGELRLSGILLSIAHHSAPKAAERHS